MKITLRNVSVKIISTIAILIMSACIAIQLYHAVYDIKFYRSIPIHTVGQCVSINDRDVTCIGSSNGTVVKSSRPMISGMNMYQICTMPPSGYITCSKSLETSTGGNLTEAQARTLYRDGL